MLIQPDATAGPAVVNTVHKTAPNTSIAFNTVPEDSADAAARWLSAANSSKLVSADLVEKV